MLRNTAIGCAIALCSSLFFFAVAEVGLRLFVPGTFFPAVSSGDIIDPYVANQYRFHNYPWIFTYIPNVPFVQRRGTRETPYYVNSRGFRAHDCDSDYGPKNGRKRLIVVGDSMVEGHGISFDHTFSHILNERVKEKNWEIVNLGVSGGSPIYYAANLRRYLALDPDAVLLVLYENDLFEDRMREKTISSLPILDDPRLVTRSVKSSSFDTLLRRTGVESLRTLQMFNRAYQVWQFHPVQKLITTNLDEEFVLSKSDEEYSKGAPHILTSNNFQRSWRMSEPYLELFRKELEKVNVKLMVVSLSLGKWEPEELQVKRDEFVKLFSGASSKWAERNSTPYHSLETFTSEAIRTFGSDDIIIKLDGHPTEKMHEMIADELSPFVTGNL